MSVAAKITSFLPQLSNQYLNQGKEPYVVNGDIQYYAPGVETRYDQLTEVIGLLWRSFEAYDQAGLCKDKETFYKELKHLPLVLSNLEEASNQRMPLNLSVNRATDRVMDRLFSNRKKNNPTLDRVAFEVEDQRTAKQLIAEFREEVSRCYEALPSQNLNQPAPTDLSDYFSSDEIKSIQYLSLIETTMKAHQAAIDKLQRAKDEDVSRAVAERAVARGHEAYTILGIKVMLVGTLYLISRRLSK